MSDTSISICNMADSGYYPPTPPKGMFGSEYCNSCEDDSYANAQRLSYGGYCFVPVCIYCHRFVKADENVTTNDDYGLVKKPNATCSKCGRTWIILKQ